MSLKIETRATGLAKVQHLLKGLYELDMTDLLDNVGALVETQIKNRIKNEKRGPGNEEWPDLDPDYAKWKAGIKPGVGMLEFEGHLFETVTHNVLGDSVEIGSGLPYAAYQHGMRPFVGLSSENEDDIEDLVVGWLEDRMSA